MGLQHKSVDDLLKDVDLTNSQILGFFNKTVKKLVDVRNNISSNISGEQIIGVISNYWDIFCQVLNRIQEAAVEQELDDAVATKPKTETNLNLSKRAHPEEQVRRTDIFPHRLS